MTGFLLKEYRRKGLSNDILSNLQLIDNEYIPLLFSTTLQLSLHTPLPKELWGDDILAGRIFSMRSQQFGSRLQFLLKDGGLSRTGVVMHQGGCFRLKFENEQNADRATSIVHNATQEQVPVPEHIVATCAFVLDNNHSDGEAKAELPPSRFFLHEFFSHALPWRQDLKVKRVQVFKTLLAQAAAEGEKTRDAKEQAVELAVASRSVLQVAAKAQANARTDKARAAIEAEKNERTKRRRLTLGSVATGTT